MKIGEQLGSTDIFAVAIFPMTSPVIVAEDDEEDEYGMIQVSTPRK